MSTYKVHILFGVILVAIFAVIVQKYQLFNFSILEFLISIPIIITYSILPDIDLRSSKISHLFRGLSFFVLLLMIIFEMKEYAITIVIVLIILEFLKHRKFVHTISAGIILSLPLIYFSYVIAIFAFAGYLSHLIIDKSFKLW